MSASDAVIAVLVLGLLFFAVGSNPKSFWAGLGIVCVALALFLHFGVADSVHDWWVRK